MTIVFFEHVNKRKIQLEFISAKNIKLIQLRFNNRTDLSKLDQSAYITGKTLE